MQPEEQARLVIDGKLEQSGWTIQDMSKLNLTASLGVAVREFPTSTGPVDYALWQAFNDYAFQNTEFAKAFNKRKPTTHHWMDFSIGSSACHISVLQIQKRNAIGVEFYINDDKELFRSLFTHKDDIESMMGITLDWRELPKRKASRIVIEKEVKFDDRDNWSQQFDYIMDVCMKMKNAFKKYL